MPPKPKRPPINKETQQFITDISELGYELNRQLEHTPEYRKIIMNYMIIPINSILSEYDPLKNTQNNAITIIEKTYSELAFANLYQLSNIFNKAINKVRNTNKNEVLRLFLDELDKKYPLAETLVRKSAEVQMRISQSDNNTVTNFVDDINNLIEIICDKFQPSNAEEHKNFVRNFREVSEASEFLDFATSMIFNIYLKLKENTTNNQRLIKDFKDIVNNFNSDQPQMQELKSKINIRLNQIIIGEQRSIIVAAIEALLPKAILTLTESNLDFSEIKELFTLSLKQLENALNNDSFLKDAATIVADLFLKLKEFYGPIVFNQLLNNFTDMVKPLPAFSPLLLNKINFRDEINLTDNNSISVTDANKFKGKTSRKNNFADEKKLINQLMVNVRAQKLSNKYVERKIRSISLPTSLHITAIEDLIVFLNNIITDKTGPKTNDKIIKSLENIKNVNKDLLDRGSLSDRKKLISVILNFYIALMSNENWQIFKDPENFNQLISLVTEHTSKFHPRKGEDESSLYTTFEEFEKNAAEMGGGQYSDSDSDSEVISTSQKSIQLPKANHKYSQVRFFSDSDSDGGPTEIFLKTEKKTTTNAVSQATTQGPSDNNADSDSELQEAIAMSLKLFLKY